MRNIARIRWLSRFDMEPLLSSVLAGGTLISVGLMVAGLVVAKAVNQGNAEYRIQAVGIPALLEGDLHRAGSPDFWHRLLVDLGFSVLLITPYARLTMTWLYLAFVKRRWRYAIYTSAVLFLLGMVVFSDMTVSLGVGEILRWYPFKN